MNKDYTSDMLYGEGALNNKRIIQLNTQKKKKKTLNQSY